ncbi:MAG: hypothetical protein JWM33_3871 [Caulobacteraceae bacterium]|nr:hypothetical protein [Caulobacteraceae bacterium]
MRFGPIAPADEAICQDFRQQIRGAGVIDPGLPFGYYEQIAEIDVRRQILVDEKAQPAKVVGSVFTKTQAYVLRGAELQVSSGTYPISLGVIERRYALAGVMLLRAMAQALPFRLFLGMGPPETNVTSKLCQTLGWSVSPAPYLFLPLRLAPLAAKRFATRPWLARAIGWAGKLGLGWPVEAVARLRAPRPKHPLRLQSTPQFDERLDEWWARYRKEVGFSLVRDSRQLNAMFPSQIGAFERWLILDGDRVAGYAILLVPPIHDSRAVFGAYVATLVEFCVRGEAVEDAARTLALALRRRAFDAVIANQTHAPTLKALQRAGFQPRETQMYLALAPALAAALEAAGLAVGDMVIGRGDGDGPIGLGVSF